MIIEVDYVSKALLQEAEGELRAWKARSDQNVLRAEAAESSLREADELLDAARAELAEEKAQRAGNEQWAIHAESRAEAAEAERDEYRLVVDHCTQVIADWEAAEARIAAALALADAAAEYLCGWGTGERCESHCDCGTAGTVWHDPLRRALTGEAS